MGLRHKGKYELSKHNFAFVYHYAMQYKEWKQEHKALENSLKGISYNAERSGSTTGDPTMQIASRRLYLESKMRIVEETSREADMFIWQYILKGVTSENMTYQKLRDAGLPCGKNYYYDRRRRFYWLLSRKI